MQSTLTADQSPIFFRTLNANGFFSTICGLAFVLFSNPIATRIGWSEPLIITLIGAGLIPFGLWLIWRGTTGVVPWMEAFTVSAMDFGWVMLSIAAVFAAPELFTSDGLKIVGLIAMAVFVFFGMQVYALWRAKD